MIAIDNKIKHSIIVGKTKTLSFLFSLNFSIRKLDKNEPIYLYCRSGKRSAKAAQILKEMGFKEIYDMEGGFLNWESQGLQEKN